MAGLFGEDLLQRGYRRDRAVLAHIAVHPGAATPRVARVVGASERVAARNPDRLTDDVLLVLVTDGATPALRSYRLAFLTEADAGGRRARARRAARYIADDPRLPKPGILQSIDGVRTRLCLAVEP